MRNEMRLGSPMAEFEITSSKCSKIEDNGMP
jgi:hypothetical protein